MSTFFSTSAMTAPTAPSVRILIIAIETTFNAWRAPECEHHVRHGQVKMEKS